MIFKFVQGLHKDLIAHHCERPGLCALGYYHLKSSFPSLRTCYYFMQGCADVVIDGVKHNLGQIAGGGIALGLIEV